MEWLKAVVAQQEQLDPATALGMAVLCGLALALILLSGPPEDD